MEEYSLIVLIDYWTSFEGVFVNKWSYYWFPRDVMRPRWMTPTKAFLSTGKLILFQVNFSRKILYYLSFNMDTLSHGCEPRIPLRTLRAHIVITASILTSAPVLLFSLHT